MKKTLIALVGGVILMGSLSPAGAIDIPDEQWVKTAPSTDGPSWGINTNDGIDVESPLGYLTSAKALNYDSGGKTTSMKTCSSFEPGECPHDEYQYYQTPLGMCSAIVTYDCIDNFLIQDDSGKKIDYTFVRNFPEKDKFAYVGDKEAELPSSASSVVFSVPDAPHAGGNLYIASAVLSGSRLPSEKKFHVDRMNISINAITIEPSTANTPFPILSTGEDFRRVNRGGDGNCRIQCNGTENAFGQTFPSKIKFGLVLKLNAKVSGWLNGRVSNVESTITTDSQGFQNISVIGYPVKVPVIFGWVQKATAPQTLKDYYGAMPLESVNGGNGYGKCLDPAKPAGYQGPCPSIYWESVLRSPQKNAQDMKEVSLWLPILKDSAFISPTAWNINSTDAGFGQNCIQDMTQLSGIVTTNATSFISGPPTFNKEEGILDYKVLAPHYLQDGSVFKGTYDLSINSKFARCLYGFSSAPVRASVSIISSDGTNQVATVITSESNGWIHLGAYGFTFSNPTVRVKLSQDAPEVVATPSPSASPIMTPKATNVKKTITCQKGKTIKKVTATKPVCPAGYKKA